MQGPGNVKPGVVSTVFFWFSGVSKTPHAKCLPAIRSTPGREERQFCWVVNMIIVYNEDFQGGGSLDESVRGQRKGIGAR